MKRIKHTLLALLMALVLAAAPACGPMAQSSEPAETSVLGSTLDTQPESIRLTDQAGREVHLEAPAEKIVSGYYISTSACIALGLTDKLVGVEAKADTRPIYTLASPQILDLPNVGSAKEFDLEGCLALEPDLVILPKRLEDSANTISEMGIPVLLVNPESQQELFEMIALIGQATGTEAAASRLLQYYEEELDAITSLTAQLTGQPRVYMGSNSSYLATAPGEMYQSSLIEAAGGTNVAGDLDGDTWTEVSYEQLIAMNPDVIVIPSEAAYDKEDIAADQQLAALTAVKNNAIYQMPRDFEPWDSPTTSCILGIRWLLNVLHEDLYSQQALEEDAAAFYRDFYSAEIDTAQIGK